MIFYFYMKYTIIFCLFIVFTNSRKEIKPKFSLENSLIRNSYDSFIKESVCKAETKDKCKALSNPEEDRVCCYMERIVNDKTEEERCRAFPKDIDKRGELVKTKEYKAYKKEEFGYRIYAEEEEDFHDKIEEKITCKKGVYSLVEEDNFSEKEKNNLKDENHCLNIYYKKNSNYKFDVGECNDHLVLDSSKKAGIDCGYFVYNISLESNRIIPYKTCKLFNLKLLSNMNKIDKIFSEGEIEDIIYSMGIYGDYCKNFTVEAYNTKGHKIRYDSKTDNFIVEGSGYMLNASKYIFLLILIVF